MAAGDLQIRLVPSAAAAPFVFYTTAKANTVILVFQANTALTLTGNSATAANWTITGGVSTSAVVVEDNVVFLTTSNQTGGTAYTVTIPSGIVDANGFANTSTSANFTGVAGSPSNAPSATSATAEINVVTVAFTSYSPLSLTGNSATAGNWTIIGGVTVSSLSVSGSTVTLVTSNQSTGTNYTLTIPSGVKDADGSANTTATINFTGNGIPAPSVISAYAEANVITLIMRGNTNLSLTGNSAVVGNWTFSSGTGQAITASAVTVASDTVTVTTSQQTTGATYTMTIPSGIVDSNSLANTGPFSVNFTGNGQQSAPVLTSVTCATNVVTLHFSSGSSMALSDHALVTSNWTFTSNLGYPITATSVSAVGTTIVVNTTNQTNGASYTINMPFGVLDGSGLLTTGPFSGTFTGSGTSPAIVFSKSLDSHAMEIVFSDQMDPITTLSINSYSISPTLTINSISQSSSRVFIFSTSHQTSGQTYTVTVSGAKSIYGNLVA